MAYLTDSEMTDNTVTVGKVKIELEEPNYPGNDSDIVKTIIPNQVIAKDPQVENSGNNAALIYLKVEVPQEDITALDENNNKGTKQTQDLFTLKDVSSQWELIRTETLKDQTTGKSKTSYVYAYKKPLESGKTTDKLFQQVQVKNFIEKDIESNVEDIIITAGAIQSTNVSDIDLTPQGDGTIPKEKLNKVYDIFLNQSGEKKSRPADEGDRPQSGKLGKISYVLNGGILADGSLTEYGNTDYGYVPPKPTKEDYTFVGWSPASIPTDSTGNITFTAQWKESSATLLDGSTIHSRFAILGKGNANITAIQQSSEQPSEAVIADANSLISTTDSENPVYAWFDNGTIKWWSKAKQINTGSNMMTLCTDMKNLTDISGLANWNTSKMTNVIAMFMNCTKLTNLSPLSNWDTSNVTDMYHMFGCCKSLTDLSPLGNWNTSNVTMIGNIFCYCSNLTNISGLKNWNTNKMQNIGGAFYGCKNLTDISSLANWDTSNVTNIGQTFYGCKNLTEISPLAHWNTGNVTNMDWVFRGCSITDISPLANWDTSKVKNMTEMFYGCTNITDASQINDWDISKVTKFTNMFFACPSHPEFTKRKGTWDSNGTFTPAA